MPISCDSQYIIDSLMELLEITPDIYEYCWSKQVDVDGLVDRNAGVHQSILAHFEANYEALSLEEKASLGFEVLLSSNLQIDEFFRHLAGKVVDAYYLGTDRRLPHPEFRTGETRITNLGDLNQIQTVFDESPIFASYRRRLNQSLQRSIDAIQQVHLPDYVEFKKVELRNIQLSVENLQQLRPQVREYLDEQDYVDTSTQQTNQKKLKQRERLGRKVLKKSIKVLDSFMGNGTTQAFIHGGKVEITGQRFKFVVEQSHVKLIEHSADPKSYHVPFKLTVTDLHNTVLGQACLLFRDTPMLDQILAIHLHVMSGKEDELIKTANFYNTTDAYRSDPNIEAVLGPRTFNPDHLWTGPGLRPAQGAEEYFALRSQVYDFLLEQSQEIIGIPNQGVQFLLHPPMHKHEVVELVGNQLEADYFIQAFLAA